MPKRTNPFQRVVRSLYEVLAPLGATVEESALLTETPTGSEREIDVLITFPTLGTQLRIAVECRDHDRPQTVEWIDSLIGKYSNLPIDKVIAVSDSGFTPAAELKAKNTKVNWSAPTLLKKWNGRKNWSHWNGSHFTLSTA